MLLAHRAAVIGQRDIGHGLRRSRRHVELDALGQRAGVEVHVQRIGAAELGDGRIGIEREGGRWRLLRIDGGDGLHMQRTTY